MSLATDFYPTLRRADVALRDDAELDLLERIGARLSFGKDEEIYGQDEEADLIYRVVKGAVRATRLLSDGRRQIGAFYREGDLFGFEAGPTHRFSAEALSDCVILVVKRSALRNLGGDVDRLIWAATNRELERTQSHLMLLCRKTACEKVASFLLDLAEHELDDHVSLPMGRQDMADYLGLTIETVSRMVTQLQTSRIVTFAGARAFQVANRAALERLAE